MLFGWGYMWEMDQDACPADVFLVDWIQSQGFANKRIYHMGTGAHHHVGRQLSDMGHCIQAITAAPDEFKVWMDLVIDHPEIGDHYKPIFGDIYQTDPRQFGRFDIVSLFHLGEFSNEIRGHGPGLSDHELIEMFYNLLDKGGYMLFYEGSYGFAKIVDMIERLHADRFLERQPNYHSLRIYTKV